MKKLVLAILMILPFSSYGLTRTSVANGDWNTPSTWSPVGVPQAADDSIIVATVVYFNGYNVTVGVPYFEVAVTGSLGGGVSDTLTFGGDVAAFNGVTTVAVCVIGASDSAVVNFELVVQDLFQSGMMINNNWICVSQQLTTSDDFMNNGSVACNDWINSGNVTGNQGQFCIAQNFINTDQISGNIDICDASPGGFGDVNMGTIAGSVTNCASGPCSSCPIPGFAEYSNNSEVLIAPNPVHTVSTIVFETGLLQSNSESLFRITDVQGRTIKEISFTGNQLSFDRTGMESGLYFYSVMLSDGSVAAGKLLVD